MSTESRSSTRREGYRFDTRRPLNCLVFVGPLLVLFQVGVVYCGGTALLAPRDLGKMLRFFGATADYLPALLVAAVLMIQHLAVRDRWEIQPTVLAGMVGESIIWMIPLIGLGQLSGKLVAQAARSPVPCKEMLENLLVATGAGIYEEFLFRLVLISLVMLIFVDVFALRKDIVAAMAVIVAACLFSLYHFSGEQLSSWEGLPWTELIFRAMAGVYLGAIFVFRGFGIAVGAHICYNLYVVMRQG